MDDFASVLHTMGLILMPGGVLIFGNGIVLARHPKFPPWIGVTMQYAGVGLALAGALYYFQPWGARMSLHVGTVIYLIVLIAVIRHYRHAGEAARGNLPQ